MSGTPLGRVYVSIEGDARPLGQAIDQSERLVRGFADRSQNILKTGLAIGLGTTTFRAGIEAASQAFHAGEAAIIDYNSKIDQTTAVFAKLEGSSAAAQKRVADLFQFAKETPFDFTAVLQGASILETLGGTALATKERLTLYGDAAAATVNITGSLSEGFKETTFWTARFYEALQAGDPGGRAALRLEQLGLLTTQQRKTIELAAEAGASANELFAIYEQGLQRFTGLQAIQQKNFQTQISTVKDSLTQLAGVAGRPIFEAFVAGLIEVNKAIDGNQIKELAKTIAGEVEAAIQRIQKALSDPANREFAQRLAQDFATGGKDLLTFLNALGDTVGPIAAAVRDLGTALDKLTSGHAAQLATLTVALVAFRREVGVGAAFLTGVQSLFPSGQNRLPDGRLMTLGEVGAAQRSAADRAATTAQTQAERAAARVAAAEEARDRAQARLDAVRDAQAERALRAQEIADRKAAAQAERDLNAQAREAGDLARRDFLQQQADRRKYDAEVATARAAETDALRGVEAATKAVTQAEVARAAAAARAAEANAALDAKTAQVRQAQAVAAQAQGRAVAVTGQVYAAGGLEEVQNQAQIERLAQQRAAAATAARQRAALEQRIAIENAPRRNAQGQFQRPASDATVIETTTALNEATEVEKRALADATKIGTTHTAMLRELEAAQKGVTTAEVAAAKVEQERLVLARENAERAAQENLALNTKTAALEAQTKAQEELALAERAAQGVAAAGPVAGAGVVPATAASEAAAARASYLAAAARAAEANAAAPVVAAGATTAVAAETAAVAPAATAATEALVGMTTAEQGLFAASQALAAGLARATAGTEELTAATVISGVAIKGTATEEAALATLTSKQAALTAAQRESAAANTALGETGVGAASKLSTLSTVLVGIGVAFVAANATVEYFTGQSLPKLIGSLIQYGDAFEALRREIAKGIADENQGDVDKLKKQLADVQAKIDATRKDIQAHEFTTNPFDIFTVIGDNKQLGPLIEQLKDLQAQYDKAREALVKYSDEQYKFYQRALDQQHQGKLTAGLVVGAAGPIPDLPVRGTVDQQVAADAQKQAEDAAKNAFSGVPAVLQQTILRDAQAYQRTGKAIIAATFGNFSPADFDVFKGLSDSYREALKASLGTDSLNDIQSASVQRQDQLFVQMTSDIKQYGHVLDTTTQQARQDLGDQADAVLKLASAYADLQTANANVDAWKAVVTTLQEKITVATHDRDVALKSIQDQIDANTELENSHERANQAILLGIQQRQDAAQDALQKEQRADQEADRLAQKVIDAKQKQLKDEQEADQKIEDDFQHRIEVQQKVVDDLQRNVQARAGALQAVLSGQTDIYRAQIGDVDDLTKSIINRYEAELGGLRRVRDATAEAATAAERQQRAQLLGFSEAIATARDAGNAAEVARLTRLRQQFATRSSQSIDLTRQRAGVAQDQLDARAEQLRKEGEQQATNDAAALKGQQAILKAIEDQHKEAQLAAKERQQALQHELDLLNEQKKAQDDAAADRQAALQKALDTIEDERKAQERLASQQQIDDQKVLDDLGAQYKSAKSRWDGEIESLNARLINANVILDYYTRQQTAAQKTVEALNAQNTALDAQYKAWEKVIQLLQGAGLLPKTIAVGTVNIPQDDPSQSPQNGVPPAKPAAPAAPAGGGTPSTTGVGLTPATGAPPVIPAQPPGNPSPASATPAVAGAINKGGTAGTTAAIPLIPTAPASPPPPSGANGPGGRGDGLPGNAPTPSSAGYATPGVGYPPGSLQAWIDKVVPVTGVLGLRTRLAMAMGAILEGGSLDGPYGAGDHGNLADPNPTTGSYGPYQVNMPAHYPTWTRARAETLAEVVPAMAAGSVTGTSYQSAVQAVPDVEWARHASIAAAAAIQYAEKSQGYAPGDIDTAFRQVRSRYGFWQGGTITEPVTGTGMVSGSTYQFAERGPEVVIPLPDVPSLPKFPTYAGAATSASAAVHLHQHAPLIGQAVVREEADLARIGQAVADGQYEALMRVARTMGVRPDRTLKGA